MAVILRLFAALSIFVLFGTATPAAASSSGISANVKRVVAFHNVSRFKYVHMTMIEKINRTFFVLAFQASPIGEGHLNQNIMMAHSYDAGETWSDPQVAVTADGVVPVWGPCFLWVERQRRLFLYFSVGVPQNAREGGRHFPGGNISFVSTSDFGSTWSAPTIVLPYLDTVPFQPGEHAYGNVSKMTANKPIFLSADEDSWALPFWCEPHKTNPFDTGAQVAGLIVATDGGRTHKATGHVTKGYNPDKPGEPWLIENWVAPLTQLPRNSSNAAQLPLEQGFRTKFVGWMAMSVAPAGWSGGAWTEARYTQIPNPDSKTSGAAMYRNVNWQHQSPAGYFLSCNPDVHGRNVLALFEGQKNTTDVGHMGSRIAWNHRQPVAVLENTTEYQSDYPTVIQGTTDSAVFVSYTCYSHSAACFSIVTVPLPWRP